MKAIDVISQVQKFAEGRGDVPLKVWDGGRAYKISLVSSAETGILVCADMSTRNDASIEAWSIYHKEYMSGDLFVDTRAMEEKLMRLDVDDVPPDVIKAFMIFMRGMANMMRPVNTPAVELFYQRAQT